MITLDKPLHNVRKPSTREIVTMAFEMPEYMAVGDGLTTCIRVFSQSAHVARQSLCFRVAYLEEVDWIHDRVFLRRGKLMHTRRGRDGGLRRCLRTRLLACSR
jgi:hypothetical protein